MGGRDREADVGGALESRALRIPRGEEFTVVEIDVSRSVVPEFWVTYCRVKE